MASNGTSVAWQDLLVETELVAAAGSGEDEVELADSWSGTGDAYAVASADRARELLYRVDLRLRAQPLTALEGPARHASALGVAPVGACGSLWVAGGSLAAPEIAALSHLEALVFSDFYVDASSGEFGGELRLGVLHRDGSRIPVRGGALTGSTECAILKRHERPV